MDVQKCWNGKRLAEHTVGPFRINQTVYPNGLAMGLHTHDTPHLSCLIGGSFSEGLGTKCYKRSTGAAIFRKAGFEHSCQFHAVPVQILRVQFDDDWLKRVEDVSATEPQSSATCSALSTTLMERLSSELSADERYSPLAAEGLILELLAETFRAGNAVERSEPKWLRDVRDRLHDTFRDQTSLTELAADAGIHPSHLARAFRKRYGCTVGEYARRVRVEYAMGRLRGSDEALATIAHVAGFADQAHFTRQFRRATGFTPGEYRRQSLSR